MVYQKKGVLDKFNERSMIKTHIHLQLSHTGRTLTLKRFEVVSKFEGDRCCGDVRLLITWLNASLIKDSGWTRLLE